MPQKGPRPHCRKYPDDIDTKLFMDCMRARAQAAYFGQEWTIGEQEYIAMWRHNDLYLHKGRHNHQYCLVRKDYEKGWHLVYDQHGQEHTGTNSRTQPIGQASRRTGAYHRHIDSRLEQFQQGQ